MGEFAIDHGGPLREFFRLFSLECSHTYLTGEPKYFIVNTAAVQVLYMQENGYHCLLIVHRTVSTFVWDRLWPCRLCKEVVVSLFYQNQFFNIFVKETLMELKLTPEK